jgi:hypothetical protein
MDLTVNASLPLAADATHSAHDLFSTDLATQTTTLLSATPEGLLSNGDISAFSISSDGKSLAFTSTARDLTSNSLGLSSVPVSNLFVRDLATSATTLITATTDGTLTDNSSGAGPHGFQFSPDGQTKYFTDGDALVDGDANNTTDLYATTAPWGIRGQIHFFSSQYGAKESDGQATIRIDRNAPLDAPATVDYVVEDGTAKVGTDYQATAGTLHFAVGQSSATFTVPLNVSSSFSDTRTATVTLSHPSGGTLGSASAALKLSGSLPATTTPAPSTAASAPLVNLAPRIVKSSTDYSAAAAQVQLAIAAANSKPGDTLGPLVTGVSRRLAGHKVTGVVIHFDEALSAASASNAANYAVHRMSGAVGSAYALPKAGVGQSVRIASARYDGSAHTVTLVFRSALRGDQPFRLKISGGQGGITDPSNNALGSRTRGGPGSDFNNTVLAGA